MIMMIADRWPGFFCRHVKLCNIGCVQHRQGMIIIVLAVITIPFMIISTSVISAGDLIIIISVFIILVITDSHHQARVWQLQRGL